LLPINTEKVRSIAIIGPNANRSINQGGGSARVTAAYSVTPLKGITALARKNDIEVNYHKGVENHPAVPLMEAASLRLNSRSEEKGLQGEYYQSYNFTGAPFRTERDEELRIFGIIDEGVFGSVLWTGDFIAKKSGEYRFSANPGLGKAKIFIDGKKVKLNEKGKPAFGGLLPAPKIGNILLSSGRHSIKVEYSAKPSFFLSFILKIVMPGVADLLKKFRFLEIGCRLPEPEISQAIDLARNADMAIIVVGSSDNYESEGEDRPSMKLTGKQNELIESILKVNQNTIVIMNTGSPIEMPWVNQSPAILQVWLPGQEGGNAIANVIFGNVNPSGKLPVTFPKILEDNPSHGYYPGDKKVLYDEGIYVGYRHYDTKNVDPLFPFGHGLSYTKFDYGSIAGPSNITSGEKINLSITVKNSGQRKGQEVVQCYIRDLESSIDRPYQELKAFQKITLEASESKPIDILLDETALSFFDPGSNDWVTEPGQFEILIGSSSRDIRSRKIINFRY
jgi:beta-glucosidase